MSAAWLSMLGWVISIGARHCCRRAVTPTGLFASDSVPSSRSVRRTSEGLDVGSKRTTRHLGRTGRRRIELETEDAEIASFATGAAAPRAACSTGEVELAGRVQVLVDLSEQVARRMELEASIAADESALSEASGSPGRGVLRCDRGLQAPRDRAAGAGDAQDQDR